MPAFVRTQRDEAKWSKAKEAAKRSKKKDESSFQDQDWALVNHIYHQMEKSEQLSESIVELLKSSKDNSSLDDLQSFLEKARRRLSDESADVSDEENEPEVGEGFREFDPDEEQDDADRWLQDNDPETTDTTDDEEEPKEAEEYGYDEYAPDEDEESHQQDLETNKQLAGAPKAEVAAPESGVDRGSSQEAPQEVASEGRFSQPSKEDIQEMRQYTRPWESRARDTQRLQAEAVKNPVLHHEGRLVEARQAAHADRQAAYDKFQQSPEYKNADPISQMEMDSKFNQDWHAQNPEHLKNAVKLHERAHLHGLKGQEEHAANKLQDLHHVITGGAQPEQAMTMEEGLQHVGGSKGEEGTVGSTTQDPASAFAAANSNFLRDQGGKLKERGQARHDAHKRVAGDYASKVGELPEYDREAVHDVIGDHPALKDPGKKAKVDKFFEHYHPLIGMSAKKVLDKLGLDPKRGDIDMGTLHEAGMHGLFQAINDYEHENPAKASFATHAGNKIRGLQQTALRDQQKVAPELKTGAKKYNLQQVLGSHGPEVGDRFKRTNTARSVNQAKMPKPKGEGEQ